MNDENCSDEQEPCHIYGDIYQDFLQESDNENVPSETSSSSSSKPEKSMLVTGFGLRNWDSLHRALLDDEQRRQMLLAKYDDNAEAYECVSIPKTESFAEELESKSSNSEVQSTKAFPLEYLMGLGQEDVECEWMRAGKNVSMTPILEEEEEEDLSVNSALRKARKYLSEHKIFEFFRFLTAHLLANLPNNPIEFLIDLLDKCLLYRSGFGTPPLLFEKSHIEQLFYLMDRMRTGFIDSEQYKTGMKTLGIGNYDRSPPLSTDGMISKEFFIDEAYESLTDLFVDMIRRRGAPIHSSTSLIPPPPTAIPSHYTFGA